MNIRNGYIYKNKLGRFQLENGHCYWTCGDYMEINIDGEWLSGSVEHDKDYYFTDGNKKIYLKNGMCVRINN